MKFSLSDKQRIALRLHRRLGSTAAVAQAMSIHRVTASRLLARGRKSLKVVELIRSVDGDPLDVVETVEQILRR
jgi:DNA-directed RNA polymerase specialized sigma24 family protein